MDSITLAKSSVRGGRDGRLRSAAATKSSPLRFYPFGLEDSALSFLWFWRGRSLFSVATASSWLAYRSAASKRSFTDSGDRRASFLSRSGSLIPVLKEAMMTGSLAPGMVFFFFVVLDSCCYDHHLDPGEDRRGGVILGHHGLNAVDERLGGDDILLGRDEDVLIAHLGLQYFFMNMPIFCG